MKVEEKPEPEPEEKPEEKPAEEPEKPQEKEPAEPDPTPARKTKAYLRIVRDKNRIGWIYFGKMEIRDSRSDELLEKPFEIASGLEGHLNFRTGYNSKRGSNEPLPEGYYNVGEAEWAGLPGDYSKNHNGRVGLGPVWWDLFPRMETERSALGIHLDGNYDTYPGSAGCVVIRSVEEMMRFVAMMKKYEIYSLTVNYGLGTVETGSDIDLEVKAQDNMTTEIELDHDLWDDILKVKDKNYKYFHPYLKAVRKGPEMVRPPIWKQSWKGLVVHHAASSRMAKHASNRYFFQTLLGNGIIEERHPMNTTGYHAGHNFHRTAGGLEINSWGKLRKVNGRFWAWPGNYKQVEVPANEVRYISTQNGNQQPGYYQIATEAQIKSLISYCVALKINDPKYFRVDKIVGHDELTPANKNDPGGTIPWNMEKFRRLIDKKVQKI